MARVLLFELSSSVGSRGEVDVGVAGVESVAVAGAVSGTPGFSVFSTSDEVATVLCVAV